MSSSSSRLTSPIKTDELFTSWLIRTALSFGTDPLAYTRFLWPDYRAWTTDLDRGVCASRLHRVASYTGQSVDSIGQSFLTSPCPSKTTQGVLPWVISIGSRNRKRSGGLAICPDCLKENLYFYRSWRYSWHTVCDKHNRVLIDHCFRCGSSIMPHRLSITDLTLERCSICKSSYDKAEPTAPFERSLAFQNSAQHCVDNGSTALWDSPIKARDWFDLMSLWISLIRKALHNSHSPHARFLRQIDGQFQVPGSTAHTPRWESLAVRDRHQILSTCDNILKLDRDDLIHALRMSQLSKQAIVGRTKLFSPVAKELVNELADNRRRRYKKRASFRIKNTLYRVKIGSHDCTNFLLA